MQNPPTRLDRAVYQAVNAKYVFAEQVRGGRRWRLLPAAVAEYEPSPRSNERPEGL
jgi:hypothetical protein